MRKKINLLALVSGNRGDVLVGVASLIGTVVFLANEIVFHWF